MIIDANVYWLPKEFFSEDGYLEQFLSEVNTGKDVKAIVENDDNDLHKLVIEQPIGQPSLDYFEKDYALDYMIAHLNKAKVKKAILKMPGCQEWLSLDLCKVYNRLLAKFVKNSQGRMVGLAVVPPYPTEENLKELDYAINELGLKGLQLSTHYGDGYLDNTVYREFFKYVDKLGIPVYIHHTPVPIEYNSIKDYENVRRSYGRCEDQIIAISREVYSTLFDDCPNLHLIHSMLGGGYFTYKTMLLPHDSGNGRFDTSKTEAIKQHMDQNIYYEMSHAQPWGTDNLEVAIKILGANKIIYGSSYPVKESWLINGPTMIKSLNISEKYKDKILEDNAINAYQL